jgi:GTPase
MSLPFVAIVGRPNVGNSTLFNRLIGGRKAIVQDDPGVTRDRHYGIARFEGRRFMLVDTGGFEPEAQEGIEAQIMAQTLVAIEEADLILMVMDAREGLTDADRAVADALRRSAKPTLHVVNKVDGPKQEALAAEFYELGCEKIFNVSAEHALGVDGLIDAVLEVIEAPQEEGSEEEGSTDEGSEEAGSTEEEQAPIRFTLLGKPNAGKSSLLNCLAGQERAIVSAVPGTTRDPIDVRLESSKQAFIVVDTAGIRKRHSVSRAMEKFAIIRALDAIHQAHVVCLIIDAKDGVTEQDAKIVGLALEEGKGLILVFTKMDLLEQKGKSAQRELKEQLKDKLQFVPYAPVLFLSSKTRKGVGRLLPTVKRVSLECQKRIPTSDLNRFLEEITEAHPPASYHGRQVRFLYVTQPQSRPPTFIVSTNFSQAIHLTYYRYFINRLRERFGFEGAPIRLFFRKKNKRGSKTDAK